MPPPPGFAPRYSLLDSWRGFTCLIVVLHHAGFVLREVEAAGSSWAATARGVVIGFYHHMNLAVPLFFVISGYCIAASMDAHRRRGASPWHFLGRRAWRIYPPYWAAVACFAAVVPALRMAGWPRVEGEYSLRLGSPAELTWAQWLGNLTLTETWRPQVFGGAPYANLTRISWTLCFEEQFYLVCFLLLLAFPRRPCGAIAAATALILAWGLAWYDSGRSHLLVGTFPEHWHEFAVGLAVYWRLVLAGSAWARRAVDLGLGGLAVVGLVHGGPAMATVGAFGLALVALRRFDETWAGRRGLAPFRACGRRCYSIYLIHLPACTVGAEALVQLGLAGFWTRALVVAPLVALAGVAAGWLFFAAVESRVRDATSACPPGGRGAPAAPREPLVAA